MLAKARLQRNSLDTEALYFLGATLGLSAAFKGTLEGSGVGAVRDASDGVDKQREVLKLAPIFHDAEFSIGLYDYTVGALPLPVKRAGGNRERARLEKAGAGNS